MQVTCQACERAFEAKRSSARYCGSTCRNRARRGRVAADTAEPAGAAEGEPTAGLKPEDPLVTAVRAELGQRENTVDGQIAIHLARQVKAATGSSASSLAKELRAVLDRCAAAAAPPAPAAAEEKPAAPDDDEVTKARKQRELKAREAAAR